MAEDNARQTEESGALDAERKPERSSGCRLRDQRVLKVKDKPEEGRLPTPPPDPQCPRLARDRVVKSRAAGRPEEEEEEEEEQQQQQEEEEEDLAAYLNELGASPLEGHSFDYDTPNSATSAMGGAAGPFAEEAFEHLDRLYAFTEQILELRDRSSKHFRRVRGLERAKALRNADRRLETALANDEELLGDFMDEDTGFAESLLDAMLSNCRQDPPTQRRSERTSVRSPSSRQRSRSLALAEQTLSGTSSCMVERCEGDKRTVRNASRNGGPKISKWTRVKAAFKWERACTNDLAEIAESNAMTPSTPTARYLRIPDVTAGSWSGSALSPCTSEISSPSTPIGRVSPASSSNEEVFDETRKNIVNYSDQQSPQAKDDKKKDDSDRYVRPFDRDTPVTENAESVEFSNEASRGKPLIRIISDADATIRIANGGGKDAEISPKRPTPTLTITIPSNEEEIRSLSSPESTSPLPSSAQDSGGSSPQRPKTRQDISSPREFKRQYSTIEEAVTPAPKIQRQDSKWNKVRRAFLTNATFSVPPSPVRAVAAQSFANDGTNHCRAEALRDYQALREKFGAEFHRKLVEWERLKSGSPRAVAARNAARDGLPLNEERLAPEFRKKLQDWKRAKKGRRTSGASFEQQRVSRRRLTDWQLWRSSSKPESRCYGKNQNSIGSRGSCASIGSAGSFSSDGKQHLCEDFVKRMEAWRRMSEAACRSNERPKLSANRVASDIIDETEFLALEKLLLLFGQRVKQERLESDAKQLNDCFDGDSRFSAASRGVNCGNEILIRTSVGSYRFEGISREFTRKLYDWEKYRGISPRSSTFRLLGPGYTPFAQDSDGATLVESSGTTGKNRAFHWSLKRSKSDGSVFDGSLREESYTLRRSTSLQSLISTDKLENDNRMDTSPASNNPQGMKDPSEDTAVEDSEPEAMIVDIEDVIEETASPLERVQPHQTPVYSVAASETTSIAVPLGTVTSSHEPSPVFLVEVENKNCERWNGRAWIRPGARASEKSPRPEEPNLPVSEDWRERTGSMDEGKTRKPWREERSREDEVSTGRSEEARRSISGNDSVKFDRPIGWNRDAWEESGEISQRYADEANRDCAGLELALAPIYESSTSRDDTTKPDSLESDGARSAQFTENLETSSTTWKAEEFMDSPRTCKGTNGTREIEDLADEPNNEQKSNAEDHQDDEGVVKSGETMLSAGSHTYQLARTQSLSDYRDPGETSLNLSDLNMDDKKDTSVWRGADNENVALPRYENCSLSELRTDVDRHYEILSFKTDAYNDTMNNRFLYEPINCHETRDSSYNDGNNSAKESLSPSRLSEMEKSNLLESTTKVITDSMVRTIPVTVSGDRESRCLERILINEQTLNKIVVPTANAERGTRNTEKHRDCFSNMEPRPDEAGNRPRDHAPTRMTGDHQVACVKKDGSTSRNVFVKTKRMIFGPFRRSEDRPFSRKEGDGSVDGRLVRSKSKSKSRSASPKLCRQDALLRVSLSLPWPLRSISKENDVTSETESRRSSGGKTEDAVTVQRRNSPSSEFINDEQKKADHKKLNDQLTSGGLSSAEVNQSKPHHAESAASASINTGSLIGATSSRVLEHSDRSLVKSIEQDRSTCRIQNEIKRSGTQEAGEKDQLKCSRTQEKGREHEGKCSRMQDEGQQSETGCDRRQHEARQQEENHPKSDAVPSDLMHKLRILSDAAARREGRATITEVPVIDNPESRSSRIRRAKESFLSRRGGPFCRSVMEPAEEVDRDGVIRGDRWGRTTKSDISITVEASRSTEIAAIASKSEKTESAVVETGAATTSPQDEIACSSEDRVKEDREIDVGLRADLVKSASAGMINVDPDTFGRLVAVDRGCESLPRTIAKRRNSSGPLAKIVGKLKLSRLIRARNADGGNMSTISTLCRQSLLIDMRNKSRDRSGSNERETESDPAEATGDKGKNDDDCSIESSSKSSNTIYE